MVLQVAANARQLVPHLDAVVAKPLPGPDAGELEDVRRADRARAQDHLGPGVRGFDPALVEEFDTGAAPALDHQPLDLRLGLHERGWAAALPDAGSPWPRSSARRISGVTSK